MTEINNNLSVKQLIENIEGKKEIEEVKPQVKLTKKEYNAMYYEKNNKKIKENYKKKSICPLCDSEVNHSSMTVHLKSKICDSKQQIKKKKLQILAYEKPQD
jgi:hypothetical protein